MKGKFMMLSVSLLLALGLMLAPAGQAAAADNRIELAYVEWDCATATTYLVKALLEKAGFEVEATPVAAAAMWQALGTGDADAIVCAWLPTTHGHYLEKVKGKVMDMGPNLTGTRIGLVVPKYVTIDSIAELNANADKFKGRIIGIDPGAGIMSKTEKAIKDYGLDKMELIEGSGATMTAALADAIKNKEWVVVTGWTPHWKFGRWELKYLKDPKGVFGGDEYINTIGRAGLDKDQPKAYAILDAFEWTPAELEGLMAENQKEGADPYKNAKAWLDAHPDKVKAWLK
jgi:glycine betaine/proline transport system substrate-binding protein